LNQIDSDNIEAERLGHGLHKA